MGLGANLVTVFTETILHAGRIKKEGNYIQCLDNSFKTFLTVYTDDHSLQGADTVKNRLCYGDCLDVMREHVEDESVDLVYLDPPFNSKRVYNAFLGGGQAIACSLKRLTTLGGGPKQ